MRSNIKCILFVLFWNQGCDGIHIVKLGFATVEPVIEQLSFLFCKWYSRENIYVFVRSLRHQALIGPRIGETNIIYNLY